jgi:predicted RNA-binding Zn ribbon-like protein
MELDHYSACGAGLAAALANRAPDNPEALRTILAEQSFSGATTVTAADVARVRAVAPRLRAILTATDVDEAATGCNELIVEAGALPHLSNHDGEPWHFHYSAPDASLGDRIVVETAVALAGVIRDEGLARFRTCASEGCDDVFVDASRNRSRRFCSAEVCANRTHVAAHRARRRAQQAG